MNMLMLRTMTAALTLGLFGAASVGLSAQSAVPLSSFEGEWVGLETWTEENPSAEEPQTVTITLEVEDGALTGTIVPFLGIRTGARITQAEVVGNELRATASAGQRSWQGDVGIQLTLAVDADAMTGKADLTMGEVDWVELDYELSRKRSRYGN